MTDSIEIAGKTCFSTTSSKNLSRVIVTTTDNRK